jgi:hypothetical protein
MKSRDSMVLYRSFYDAIKLLPDDTQLEIFRAIFEFGLDGIEPELSKSALPFWLLIKPNLQANRTKWESGSKAKRKQGGSKNEAKHKQKASETEANVDVDVDVDKDENEEVDVKVDLSDLSKFESKYDKQMLADFQAYWTETDQKGKMRFQAEKFFDISRRLATWARNQSSFSKNQKNASTSFPAENSPSWRPSHHKNIDFSNTIETK